MARRLTRTKNKIAVARIPYRTPTAAELPERLTSVCSVVHAIYTAGHAPHGGDAVVRPTCAPRPCGWRRQLVALMPDEADPAAVLALLLLTEARRPARVDAAGDPVLLADQDRRGGTPGWSRRAPRCSPPACGAATGWPTRSSCRRRSPSSTTGPRATPPPTGRRSSGSTTCCSRWRPAHPAASPAAVARGRARRGRGRARRPWPTCRTARGCAGVRSELLARCGRYAEAAGRRWSRAPGTCSPRPSSGSGRHAGGRGPRRRPGRRLRLPREAGPPAAAGRSRQRSCGTSCGLEPQARFGFVPTFT